MTVDAVTTVTVVTVAAVSAAVSAAVRRRSACCGSSGTTAAFGSDSAPTAVSTLELLRMSQPSQASSNSATLCGHLFQVSLSLTLAGFEGFHSVTQMSERSTPASLPQGEW